MKRSITHIIGIDEAGRGPLAGPVAVGVCMIPKTSLKDARLKNLIKKHLKQYKKDADYPYRDSKQMSEHEREDVYRQLKNLQKEKVINWKVCMSGPTVIDCLGLTKSINRAMERGLKNLKLPCSAKAPQGEKTKNSKLFLDGSLKAPSEYIHKETLIKGDEREVSIALASICAKVERDRYMKRQAKKFPQYGWEQNKGYGTRKHREAILKFGACDLHRKSFLKNKNLNWN